MLIIGISSFLIVYRVDWTWHEYVDFLTRRDAIWAMKLVVDVVDLDIMMVVITVAMVLALESLC